MILVMMSYTPTFLEISQSEDETLTVEEVQLGPADDRLQSLSNEDFLAPTNSKKTCVSLPV